jgi:hypothetical protein
MATYRRHRTVNRQLRITATLRIRGFRSVSSTFATHAEAKVWATAKESQLRDERKLVGLEKLRLRARARAWRRANPARACAYIAIHRTRKRGQDCLHCTVEDIEAIYRQAIALGHQVDHIVPVALGGATCARNLQVLSPQQHREKTKRDLAAIAASRPPKELQ